MKSQVKPTKPKRVRCFLCGRKMAQSAPRNRDPLTGKSAHYDCVADACVSALRLRHAARDIGLL